MSRKFEHPAYKQMANENSRVNSLSNNKLKEELERLSLNTKGTRPVIQKRLKQFYRKKVLSENKITVPVQDIPDFYIVVDFEATCEEINPENYQHEIIEFPALIIDRKSMATVAEFRSFCRPSINSQLSDFCMSLTGISQKDADSSPSLEEVLFEFDIFIKRNITKTSTFSIATDGPWDINKFLKPQCDRLGIVLQSYWSPFVNIRKHFTNFYKLSQNTVETMLLNLGMEFIGRPHRGIDDTTNIARILVVLLKDGSSCNKNDCFRAWQS